MASELLLYEEVMNSNAANEAKGLLERIIVDVIGCFFLWVFAFTIWLMMWNHAHPNNKQGFKNILFGPYYHRTGAPVLSWLAGKKAYEPVNCEVQMEQCMFSAPWACAGQYNKCVEENADHGYDKDGNKE